MLHILSDKKRRAFYQTQLNKTEKVLFEGDIKEGYMHGFTRNYVKVKAKYDPVLVNELKSVYLTNISPDGDVEITESEEILVH
jgi:threonylcarbamoyladenosine tRNA methylthiotransferase MtaB